MTIRALLITIALTASSHGADGDILLDYRTATGITRRAIAPGAATDILALNGSGIVAKLPRSTFEPALTDGSLSLARIAATGPASSSTYLRGDGVWAGVSAGAATSVAATMTALGVEPTPAVTLANITAAANNAQQASPSILLTGAGWKTNATAASQSVALRCSLLPVQGAASPTASLVWGESINGAAFTPLVSTQGGGTTIVTYGTSASSGGFSLRSGYNSLQLNIGNNSWWHTAGGVSIFHCADQYVGNPGLTIGTAVTATMIALSTTTATTARSNSTAVGFSRESSGVIQWGIDDATAATGQTLKAHDVTTGTGASLTLRGGNGSVAGGEVIITTSATTTPVARLRVKASGVINIANIPTSASGLVSGDLWSSAGVIMIVP